VTLTLGSPHYIIIIIIIIVISCSTYLYTFVCQCSRQWWHCKKITYYTLWLLLYIV